MNEVSRGQFLKQLGLGTKALMAVYCLGAVSACSNEEEPTPNSTTNNTGNNSGNNAATGIKGTTTGSAIDFTIDLAATNYTKLKTEGEYVFVEGIIIANAKGKYVALSKTCTHQGSEVIYRKSENDIWCSSHGSEFGLGGEVEKSPATKGLTVYKAELSTDGKSLNIKA